ncbi:MAG: endolytic transglycosylase MltG [Muribaculaceae bacterium]|nr:endolytic transglycosylase MltG [Muribaculaceae bacterium]
MKKNDLKRILLAAIAVIVVVMICLCLYFCPVMTGGAEKDAEIRLRKGNTVEMVTDSIAKVLGDDFAQKVKKSFRMLRANVSNRQGAYRIKAGESPMSVARKIRNGMESGVKFTFNNVRTKQQWAERVGETFAMDGDSILALLNDADYCAQLGFTTDKITAMLLPDTYEFYWCITPERLLEKLHGYYEKFWDKKRLEKAAALGLTPAEVTIVGSIVEEETAKRDERGKVGRLYLNRIERGMQLQADPTVKFAIGDFGIKRITLAMTRVNSPYNTYVIQGLPPGPIRMVEKGTLDAVLNAPRHNYLYMCAKEDFSGYHNFTASYSEHMANARRYQAALNARGIK